MEETQPTLTPESGYRNIDKLPLGKLLKIKQGEPLRKKKKSLANKLRLKGPKPSK